MSNAAITAFDVWVVIFSFLSVAERLRLTCVDRSLRQLVRRSNSWGRVVCRLTGMRGALTGDVLRQHFAGWRLARLDLTDCARLTPCALRAFESCTLETLVLNGIPHIWRGLVYLQATSGKSLRELQLNDTEIDDLGAGRLALAFPRLRVLTLNHSRWLDGLVHGHDQRTGAPLGLAQLGELLHLRTLELSHVPLRTTAFLCGWARLTKLKHLTVFATRLDVPFRRQLWTDEQARTLGGLGSLQELHLAGFVAITADRLCVFYDALPERARGLESLECYLHGRQGAAALQRLATGHARRLASVRSLCLAGCKIHSAYLTPLAAFTGLRRLRLNLVAAVQARSLAVLQHLSQLRLLRLRFLEATDPELLCFVPFLPHLHTLALSGRDGRRPTFGGGCCLGKQLAHYVVLCPQLEHLLLDRVADPSDSLLAHVHRIPMLRRLTLSNDARLTNSHVQALHKISGVTRLDVWNCPGVAAPAIHSLLQLPGLKTVCLFHTAAMDSREWQKLIKEFAAAGKELVSRLS